jgi:hypothetical protein
MFSRARTFGVVNQTNSTLQIESTLREGRTSVSLAPQGTTRFSDKKLNEITVDVFVAAPTERVAVLTGAVVQHSQSLTVSQADVDAALAKSQSVNPGTSATDAPQKKHSKKKKKKTLNAPPASWLAVFPEGSATDDLERAVVKAALLKYGTSRALFAGASKSALHAAMDAVLNEIDLDDTGLVSPAELEQALDGNALDVWLRNVAVSAINAAPPSPMLAPRASVSGNSAAVTATLVPANKVIAPQDLTACDGESGPLLLGSGAFGVVYKMHWSAGPFDVAVKHLLATSDDAGGGVRKLIDTEVSLQLNLSHPNVLEIYGVVLDGPTLQIVMPLLACSLFAVLHKPAQRRELPWSDRARICSEIASGLNYLHTRTPVGMLHRDLKSSNVMLSKRDDVKLADFGLAQVKSAVLSIRTARTNNAAAANSGGSAAADAEAPGSVPWSAPELLKLRPVHSVASDVYALGVVAFELATYALPFAGTAPAQVVQSIKSGGRPKIECVVPREFVAIMEQCWAQDAAARPKVADAVKMFRTLSEKIDDSISAELQVWSMLQLDESTTPELQLNDLDW